GAATDRERDHHATVAAAADAARAARQSAGGETGLDVIDARGITTLLDVGHLETGERAIRRFTGEQPGRVAPAGLRVGVREVAHGGPARESHEELRRGAGGCREQEAEEDDGESCFHVASMGRMVAVKVAGRRGTCYCPE